MKQRLQVSDRDWSASGSLRSGERPECGGAILRWPTRWLVAIWVVGLVFWMRRNLLDDALIHLRIAENWVEFGWPAYSPGEQGFGSSSPLYVLLLAFGSLVHHWYLLPKLVAVVAYIALLVGVARRSTASVSSCPAYLALFLALLSPFAVRWLTDGMETSLEALAVWLLPGGAVLARARTRVGEGFASLGLALAACAMVLLRIENLMLLAFVIAAIVFPDEVPQERRARLVPALAVALGAGCGLLLTRYLSGSFVPDTAVAKASGGESLAAAALDVSKAVLGAGSFGLGLVLAWLLSLLPLWNARTKVPLWALAVNLAPFALVGLIAFRGQYLQGVRHLSWIFFFLIAWNGVRASARFGGDNSGGRMSESIATFFESPRRRLILALALVALFATESLALRPLIEARTRMLTAMSGDPIYRQLEGRRGVASDIGFVGYFSKAALRDISGLVHGREVAEMTKSERIEWAFAEPPDLVFLDSDAFAELEPRLSKYDLVPVRRYYSRNLRAEQTVILAVASTIAGDNDATGSDLSDRPLGR